MQTYQSSCKIPPKYFLIQSPPGWPGAQSLPTEIAQNDQLIPKASAARSFTPSTENSPLMYLFVNGGERYHLEKCLTEMKYYVLTAAIVLAIRSLWDLATMSQTRL